MPAAWQGGWFADTLGFSLLPAVIKDFCRQLGADGKQMQGLIRLAKKNGEKLGFLA